MLHSQTLLRLDWRFEVDDTHATASSSSSSSSNPLYSASVVFDIASPMGASALSSQSVSSASSTESYRTAAHVSSSSSSSSSDAAGDEATGVSSVDVGIAAREAAQAAMLGRVGALAHDIRAMRQQCAQFVAATRASRQPASAATDSALRTTTAATKTSTDGRSSARRRDNMSHGIADEDGEDENEYHDDVDALFDEPASVDDEVIGAPKHKRAKKDANSPPPLTSSSAAPAFDPFAVSDDDEGGQEQGSDDDVLDCTGDASSSAASSSSSSSSAASSSSSPSTGIGAAVEASRTRPAAAPHPPGWSRLTPQQRVEQTMKRLSRDMKRKR